MVQNILNTGETLNYPANPQGACDGYTIGWIEAMLASEDYLFTNRIKKIQQDKNILRSLISSVIFKVKSRKELVAEDRALFDILGFYERLELFHTPEKYYPGFFPKPLSQGNIDEISCIASSQPIIEKGGLHTVYSDSFIYKLEELEKYLEHLLQILSSVEFDDDLKNTGILIASNLHMVGIIFDHVLKQWSWYLDANEGEAEAVQNTHELVNSMLSFKNEYELVVIDGKFQPEKGKLYVTKSGGKLCYAILNSLNDLIIDNIDAKELKSIPSFPVNLLLSTSSLHHEQLKPYLLPILNIVSRRGHTRDSRYLPLNVKVITVKNNKHLMEWHQRFSEFKNYQSITREIAHRCATVNLLYIAAQHGNIEVVNKLLRYPDLQINHIFGQQFSILYIAAQNGHYDVVNALLQHPKIKVNEQMHDGATALMIAAQHGYIDIVNVLLNHPDIDSKRPLHNGATPLFMAAQNGHCDVFKALLPYSNINKRFDGGATALYIASQNGHSDIVDILLKRHDININNECFNGTTPLYIAAYNGHLNIVEALLQHPQIKVNHAIKDSKATALLIATQNGYLDIVIALLNHPNIDVNATLNKGTTALISAVQRGHVDIVRALLGRPDIEIDKQCDDGLTALTIAEKLDNKEIVNLINQANITRHTTASFLK
ncbi:MAG: ankyrin repeat domain-containing protein [Gammaproteobacteria bacterium]|nr:ankyrin repeat domain-containing protein [Gammaproteobacteria bacterium]